MNPDLDDGASTTVPPDSPQNRLLAMEERLSEPTQLVAALKGPDHGLHLRPPSPNDGMLKLVIPAAALQLLDCRQRGQPVERHSTTFLRILKDLQNISPEARSCLYLATLDKELAALLLVNSKPDADLASLSALAGTLHLTLHRPRPGQVGSSAPPPSKISRSGPKPLEGTTAKLKFLAGSFKPHPDAWSLQSFAAPLRTANYQMQKWLEHNRLCLKCRQEGHTSESCPGQTKN